MKKIVALLMVALALCVGFALAEESSFTFRNGLYWGMTPEEVLAAEGRSAFDVEYINRSEGTSQCLLQNVSVGSFQAEIVFNFLEERLISAAIVPEATDAATLEQMMYLVYGQPDTGAITRENVTAAWQIAPNAYVCVVEDMTDGVYLCYFDAEAGLPTALYGAVPTATPAPKYETNKPIVTPKPTEKPTPAPVTAAPTVTPTCEPAEDTEIYLETPTPTPTPTPAVTAPPMTDVIEGGDEDDEIGGDDCEENVALPDRGDSGIVVVTPTPPCETNVPLDREDEEDCEPNLPLDREESTEAPSTSWKDVSGVEEVIGGDEDDCEPNEDTDIFLDP